MKNEGNLALKNGNFEEAIKLYTSAINKDEKNPVLYSNRSAAYSNIGNYAQALADSEKVIILNPTWFKGYLRKAEVLRLSERFDEALESYLDGLKLDRENLKLQTGLQEVCAKRLQNLINMFMDPQCLHRLSTDPRTASFFQDPDYMKFINDVQLNPNLLLTKLSDDKILTTLEVLLKKTNSFTNNSDILGQDNTATRKLQALAEKNFGNVAYKKKDFDASLVHYNRAIEFDPTEMTYYLNKAAVYFEKKCYLECISECEKAINIGRENRADFKLIAKAFTRIGNSYNKLGNLKQAKVYYEKSMSEHRTPEIKSLLSDVEKALKEEERRAYIDPVKAEEEKELGNIKFKDGDYASAVKHYTEAILRNPNDPKYYSNRAACYTKLAAFDLGLKDCDKCLEIDPKFLKGWLRKGKILQGLQQQGKALSAYQKALELDPSNAEALEGYRQCSIAVNSNPEEVRKRAMTDPEIQSILRDPAMRLILEQMQNDPKALQE